MIDVSEEPISIENKRRGRPKKTRETPIVEPQNPPESEFADQEEPQTEAEPTEAAPFPPIAPKTNFDTLADYWNNRLTAAQRRRGCIYLYRLHPKMLLAPGRGGRPVNANCEKFNEEDGPLTREAIRKRRRMGIYLLRLTQRVVKPYGEITNAEMEVHGDLSNADDMPILDVDNLDVEHPSNRDYIRILRSRGILKAGDKEGEGEDMAASEVLGSIAGRAIDVLAERGQQGQPQQPQSSPADPAAGVMGGKLVDLLEKQINQSRPVEQQGTVLDMVESLVKIGGLMKPEAPDFGPLLASIEKTNQMMLDLKEQEVRRAQADADRARTEAQQFRQALPQPKSIDEQWDELERSAKRFKRMTGEKDKDQEDEKEPAAAANPATGFMGILSNLPSLFEKGVQMLSLYAVIKYNEKLQPGQFPMNPQTAQPDGQPAKPEVVQSQQQPQQTGDDMQAAMQEILNQMERVRPLLLTALRRGKTGSQFAQQLVDLASEEEFEALKSISIQAQLEGQMRTLQGKEAIWVLIQQYPPIWDAELAPGVKVSTQQPRLIQFLNDFFSYQSAPVN